MSKESNSPSTLQYSIISGASSGAISAVLFQPLEYLKTKLQQPTFKYSFRSLKSYTLKQLIIITLTDEHQKINTRNIPKFWSGLTPSLVRSVPIAGIYFGCIDTFKNIPVLADSKNAGQLQLFHSFIIGSLSKVIADLTTFPLGLIKTRYESEVYNYKGIRQAFIQISRSEGFYGLYKGLNATLVRDITYSGIYFTLYTKIKHIASNNLTTAGSDERSIFFASCALASSVLASLITQPPDVVRAYIQLDPEHNKKYEGMISAARKIYEKKGVQGFFAGFVPRSLRRVFISVMSWTIYEKFTLTKKPDR